MPVLGTVPGMGKGAASHRYDQGAESVRLNQVCFAYPGSDELALDNVSLRVPVGDFVYLVGPSGSGKSSLLRVMYAEERATAGTAWVAGANLARMRPSRIPAFRRRLGVVFQDYKLLEGRTVSEQVSFALTVLGRRHEAPTRVPAILARVGLAGMEDRLPGELSGGEQQRVAIARALVSDPVMLLCDEPTGNLDPETGRSVMALLEQINAAGTTVVMSTHDAGLVDTTPHRVVALDAGRIVRDDGQSGYREGER